MIRLAALLTVALAQPAGAFELAWPVDCRLGDTCYIQQYPDHDPGPAATDFTCGALSYDGHDGTDIAVIDRAQMADGVAVLAAADGVVKGARDGVQDFVPFTPGKECGNGVLVEHADGWQTQYCHMREGSVSVRAGDRVTAGDKLGLVGQSGMADFPHMHLAVRHDGQDVDPFDPDGGACAPTQGPTLWDLPVPYQPGGLLEAGFSDAVPSFDAIRAGLDTQPLPATAPGLVLWAFAYGTQAGDEMTFQITGPAGQILKETVAMEKSQAQMFRALGKKLTTSGWPAGRYDGAVRLIRHGVPLDQADVQVQVGP